MREVEEFADLKFKMEYGEMVLTKVGDDPFVLRGLGEIWQDEDRSGDKSLSGYKDRS